jgi:hypothetical protein
MDSDLSQWIHRPGDHFAKKIDSSEIACRRRAAAAAASVVPLPLQPCSFALLASAPVYDSE